VPRTKLKGQYNAREPLLSDRNMVNALGVATVFMVKDMSRKVLDGMLGFAVMMVLDVALG
jgi:hypothetical protein